MSILSDAQMKRLDPDERQLVYHLCGDEAVKQALPHCSVAEQGPALVAAAEVLAYAGSILVVAADDWLAQAWADLWDREGRLGVQWRRKGDPASLYAVTVTTHQAVALDEDYYRTHLYETCLLVGPLDDDVCNYLVQAVRSRRYWRLLADGEANDWPLETGGKWLTQGDGLWAVAMEAPGALSRPSSLAERSVG